MGSTSLRASTANSMPPASAGSSLRPPDGTPVATGISSPLPASGGQSHNQSPFQEGATMARGDKSKYTDKQKRKAEHIAEGYEERGVSEEEAKRRAWATVNKESGGGNKSGSGRDVPDTHVSSKKGGKLGGAASASRTAAERSASAKKAARTRARRKA